MQGSQEKHHLGDKQTAGFGSFGSVFSFCQGLERWQGDNKHTWEDHRQKIIDLPVAEPPMLQNINAARETLITWKHQWQRKIGRQHNIWRIEATGDLKDPMGYGMIEWMTKLYTPCWCYSASVKDCQDVPRTQGPRHRIDVEEPWHDGLPVCHVGALSMKSQWIRQECNQRTSPCAPFKILTSYFSWGMEHQPCLNL